MAGDRAPFFTPHSGDLWDKLKPLARQMRHEPTASEDRLWQCLRRGQVEGCHFRRQHAIERFIVDFYCATTALIVEVDGTVHQYTAEEDAVRQEYLESLGLHVLRFSNDQVLEQIDWVIERIASAVQEV